MRRSIVIGLITLLACHTIWRAYLTRSSTIQLEYGSYELTYTMAWDWGMAQRFSISKKGDLWPGVTSEWMKIWDKAYRSGISVYFSSRESVYYIGSILKVFRFDPATGRLEASCHSYPLPKAGSSSLGQFTNGNPAARNFNRFIEENELGAISNPPLDSKYYEDLKYIGQFGLMRSRGSSRGGDAAFSPADKSAEPLFGLRAQCG